MWVASKKNPIQTDLNNNYSQLKYTKGEQAIGNEQKTLFCALFSLYFLLFLLYTVVGVLWVII